ncbi:prepilin peptidase [Puniceicoccaceae bacterium K14]|nr:prepilin peptidase [Puniceicoccaceae bacterium K14]
MLENLQTVNQEFPWFFQITIFIFGSIVGSFLNVCIYRIPAKKSVVYPGSTCGCGKAIAPYDNIPILSWFILRGKARCCGQSYSIRYPLVEALTGILFLLAWLEYPPLKAGAIMFFASLLICAAFIDFDTMEIPDRFSLGTAFLGFCVSIGVPQLHGYASGSFADDAIHSAITSILGILIGSGFILWLGLTAEAILRKDAMGFGDVKLLGGIGAFIGWQGAIFSLFGGAVIGTIGLLTWVLVKPFLKQNKTDEPEETQSLVGQRTPFGPMLASGALVHTLFLEKEVNDYFQLVIDLMW